MLTGAPVDEAHGTPLLRVLTDRGTEFCANPETNDYELYLGICEGFQQTVLNELYR